jgi:NADH:ubiquinone oxidoreductase subunit K
MFTIGLLHYLILSAALFCCGVFVMVTKRNAIGILIGVELLLNSVNINFVAFDRYRSAVVRSIDGQISALFVIVLAAAEAAVAVAICMNLYKNLNTIDVDRGDALHG